MESYILVKLKSFINPERFQGWGKKRKYFEGWYYKIVNKEESKAFAFIPGIAIDDTGRKHKFIKVLDGKKKTSEYITFPAEAFVPRSTNLNVSIT